MKKLFLIVLVVVGFYFVVSWPVMSQTRSKQVWRTPEQVEMLLQKMNMDIEPTLPPPRLVPEREYTWSWENTIYWYGDSVRVWLSQIGSILLFFEARANYVDTELWGFVNADVDSATFVNLPEGIPIEYRVRYFAQDSIGRYQVSYWSSPETSIQDAEPPVVDRERSGVLDLEESGGKRWVNGPAIRIRVVATDSTFGKVMQIAIREKSAAVDDTLFYDIDTPSMNVETVIPYTMRSPQKIPVTLSWWAYDLAEQPSFQQSVSIFWWPPEEGKGRLICFPNPFNPDQGGISTIKVGVSGVTEAEIFDLFGNLVRVLHKDASASFFEWDGRNGRGDMVSKGGYFCVVKGNPQLYCKIAVLR